MVLICTSSSRSTPEQMDFSMEDTRNVTDYIPAKRVGDHLICGRTEDEIRGSDSRGNVNNGIDCTIVHRITREHRMPLRGTSSGETPEKTTSREWFLLSSSESATNGANDSSDACGASNGSYNMRNQDNVLRLSMTLNISNLNRSMGSRL